MPSETFNNAALDRLASSRAKYRPYQGVQAQVPARLSRSISVQCFPVASFEAYKGMHAGAVGGPPPLNGRPSKTSAEIAPEMTYGTAST